MRYYLLLVLIIVPLVAQGAVGDTLKYRGFYYPSWCQRPLDDSQYGAPPWYIDLTGTTHVMCFNNGFWKKNANTSQPEAPWLTCINGGTDSMEFNYGPTGGTVRYLDSLLTICHSRNPRVSVLLTLQSVGGQTGDNAWAFDQVAADSAKTEAFTRAWVQLLLRRGFDGTDINYEGDNISSPNSLRFVRILRRNMYNAPWASYLAAIGKSGFVGGRGELAAAIPRGTEGAWAVYDSMFTLIIPEVTSYEWVWNGSSNVVYHMMPLHRVGHTAHPTWNISALDYEYDSGFNLIQTWVNAGWTRSKISPLAGASMVTGSTVTSTFFGAMGNGGAQNLQLYNVERMTSYGLTKTYDATADAPYMSGTAVSVNPIGISGQMVLPYSDSTSLNHAVQLLHSYGAGGWFVYDMKGDWRPGVGAGHTNDWKRHPYIYRSIAVAKTLHDNQQSQSGSPPTLSYSGALQTPSSSSAILGGQVNPGGAATTIRILWGVVSGTWTDSTTVSAIPNGTSNVTFADTISGLYSVTAYYTVARAYNANGSVQSGPVQSFVTATACTGFNQTQVDSIVSFRQALWQASIGPQLDSAYARGALDKSIPAQSVVLRNNKGENFTIRLIPQ